MNESLFQMYCRTQDLIDRAEACKNEHSDNLLPLLNGWKESNELIENRYPQVKQMLADIKEQQSRKNLIQKSFSNEQRDFICYQIGDWYTEWQEKMWVDGKPNQHWLGIAKEQLKTLICGD
jgi:hypothetical protein